MAYMLCMKNLSEYFFLFMIVPLSRGEGPKKDYNSYIQDLRV